MIKIGFSTRQYNPMSALIRWLTNAKVSHVFFLVDDPLFGVELVVEATEVGFRAIPFEKFKRSNNVVAVYEPKHDMTFGFRNVAKNLGSGYDFFGLIGMIIVLIRKWLNRKVRNPFQNSTTYFCSEAIARALNDQDYPGWKEVAPSTVDPNTLYKFFESEKQ